VATLCKPGRALPEYVVTQEAMVEALRTRHRDVEKLELKLQLVANTTVRRRSFLSPLQDLLLLDEAGWCAELRQRRAHLPIMVLMSQAHEDHIAHVLDQGADHCVVKPFSPGELAARIRVLLRRVRRARGRSMFQESAPKVLRSSESQGTLLIGKTYLSGRKKRIPTSLRP
jgi:DNA-binding response OmpR family regulator